MAMHPDTTATVILGQHVRSGYEDEYVTWQHGLNELASHYPGFIGAEVTAPTALQPDWVVVYRFDSVANVQAWLNSAARQERLAEGSNYVEGAPTQQVIGGAAKPTDQLVTVVVSHRVSPEQVDDFLAWQDRLRLAESKFDGFRGTELFRPIEGIQDEWTALYRYANADELDKWLISDARRELLAEGAKFSDFQSRTIDNSFGSWFAFDEKGAEAPPPPSDTKTSIAVWVGLYPTVVLLTLMTWPLKLPIWLGMLVGNLMSSFAMSFLTMPYYVNPLLKRWLRPPPNVSVAKTNWRGFGIVVALMVFWTVVFYLVTKVFWHIGS
jgi:antibiotic biosynthesis monooxygenase (ABM) superfamily enzyme